jgi:response regulator RpfG family c-di-GMP phosphodiesterase
MSERVLFVDDEQNVLDGLRRQLRKRFDVTTALGGEAALETISNEGPFAVVVSDMKMPGMNGAQFLTKVRETEPDSIRMILSGQSELDSAIDAVNNGNIFRFLTKPVETDTLVAGLETAIEQYRLIKVEKELLEQTLSGAVQVLTEVLSLVNPESFSRTSRIRHYAEGIADQLGLKNAWQIRIASMLSQIGCITLPVDVLTKSASGKLNPVEQEMFRGHAAVTAQLVERIPRLEVVSRMIAGELEAVDLAAQPDEIDQWDPAVLGSQILRVAIEYEQLLSSGQEPDKAREILAAPKHAFPAAVLQALRGVKPVKGEMVPREVDLKGLSTRMVLDQDVQTAAGMLLVPKGEEVTFAMLQRLRNFAKGQGVKEPLRVLVSV